MKITDILTQDLMWFGITPQRQNLLIHEQYEYPPFFNFYESGDSYLPINWTRTSDGLRGTFSTPEYSYEIQIDKFIYPFNGQIYNCANVGFVVSSNGNQTTELTPTQFPLQVFGTVMNGVGEKVITMELDAIIMVATNAADRRIKLYDKLADKYLTKFGNVYKHIKTTTGLATVIISHRVPTELQHSLYTYALNRSATK